MSPLPVMVDSTFPEQSLLNHLKGFLPMYLSAVDVQRGLAPGFTSLPKAWEVVSAIDLSSEPQMPAIFIVSPGMSETPAREGNGTVRATWEMNVAAIVTGPDQNTTEKLAKRYAAAIANCILQKKSLGDPKVRGTDYLGDSYNDLPADERRTKGLSYLRFTIEYDHVAQTHSVNLPIVPPADPTAPLPNYPTLPDIGHVHIDVAKKQ